MLEFMTWFHSPSHCFDNGQTFLQTELFKIRPVDIHDWLAVKCFGRFDYNIDEGHCQTLARASTLQLMKKSVSFSMPNKRPQWCNDRGNPTKSAIVNDLLQLVKKFEARREGAPSQVKRPLTQVKFLFIQRKLRSQNNWMHGMKYRTMNLWQFHLIGRANDTCHFEMRDPRGHQIYDFALQTRVRWTKNIVDERK